MNNLLIIGYGNLLRRDDGAGRMVADTVASWGLAGVAVQSVHQLVPELVEELRQARRVVFVDSTAEQCAIQARRLDVAAGQRLAGHAWDPQSLLSLTRDLYGVVPTAWLLAVPGTDFGMGAGLSPAARSNVKQALGMITAVTRQEPPI